MAQASAEQLKQTEIAEKGKVVSVLHLTADARATLSKRKKNLACELVRSDRREEYSGIQQKVDDLRLDYWIKIRSTG